MCTCTERRRAGVHLRWAELCAAIALVLAFAATSSAGAITLAWNPSPSLDVAGYLVRYGTAPGEYTEACDFGLDTSGSVRGLVGGQTYYFVVHTYSSSGILSTPSNEVSGSTTNTPPQIANPGPQSSIHGTAVNFSVTATDAEGDPLAYFVTGLPSGLYVDPATGAIAGTPTRPGLFNVTMTATDGSLTASTSFNWTVLPRTCPCSIWDLSTVPPAPIEEEDTRSVEIGLKFRAESNGLITGLRFYKGINNTGIHVGHLWTSTGTQLGEVTFGNESVSGWQQASFASPIQISANTTYVASYFAPVGLYTETDGFFGSSIDNAPLHVLADGEEGPNGVFYYGPSSSFPMDPFASSNYWVDVVFNPQGLPANRAPIIATVPDLTSAENSSPLLPIAATDPDGDPLTFSATGLPSGVAINATTGVISGTLSYTSAGIHSVTITVTDGMLSASRAFTWTVTKVNAAPTLAAIPNRTDAENDTVTISASATDPDGDSVTYSAAGLPQGVAMNATTGVISGTLTYSSAGVYSVTVTASDGTLTASRPFTWTVTDVNRAPVLTAPGNLTTPQGTEVTLRLTGTDPDNDVLSFGATGLPPGVSVDAVTGRLTGTPSNTGTYLVAVSASDGSLSASQSFTWQVVTQQSASRVPFAQATVSATSPSQTVVTIAYPAPQMAGDLNVVVVAWRDATAAVQSITDTNNNAYTLAVGPTTQAGVGTQAIYYAANIAPALANGNAVTITFTSAASLPEVRIAEYGGIEHVDPVDAFAAAHGSGSLSDSGPAITTTRNDLIFGASLVPQAATSTQGVGFIARLVTGAGNIMEERVVNTVGTYTATAPVDPPGAWIMQLVAFKDTNHAPTLTRPADQTSEENATINLPLVAADPDDDLLTYTATGLPAGLSVNSTSGVISGTLAYTNAGTYTVVATVSDGRLANSQTFTWTITSLARPPALTRNDFDGDGKADLAVYHPATGTWTIKKSSGAFATSATVTLGLPNDVPVPGDYDGDGKADVAVYRPSNGLWQILLSSTNYATGFNVTFGLATDVPVPGDYDGDGKLDIAVFRPSSGTWFILKSSTGYGSPVTVSLGGAADIPVPGDYDGDAKTDVAIYSPGTGTWTILQSQTNTVLTRSWGNSTDVPVPGDYDGDGRTDVAIYRAASSTWYILKSSTNFTAGAAYALGASNDVPVPGDYDGDGKTDPATFQPATGLWTILLSSSNFQTSVSATLGGAADVALPSVPGSVPRASGAKMKPTSTSDYDGDGKTDPVVYTPSTGVWSVRTSSSNFTGSLSFTLGASSDIPVPGDYDGDGKTDVAVYSPGTGLWSIKTSTSGYATTVSVTLGGASDVPIVGDFDGDGKADVAVYRPSTGVWSILTSSSSYTSLLTFTLGGGSELAVPADYDGDGKTDVATYQPSTGTWSILTSSSGYTTSLTFNWGDKRDVPVPGDYDGDGKADVAVYRPSSGTWYVLRSTTNFTSGTAFVLGNGTDTPMLGDYDGDGQADVAVYHSAIGTWSILASSTGYASGPTITLGASGDLPVPGPRASGSAGSGAMRSDAMRATDFDGDGKSDVGLYRPSTGGWSILRSTSGYASSPPVTWGASTDIPVAGDFDGDGKADIAVYRPSTGTWYILQSHTNYTAGVSYVWGSGTDIPVPGDYDGDGITDLAVFHLATATWQIRLSGTNTSTSIPWGASTDIPVPGDYDGDGKTDLAVYHPTTGAWSILFSSTGNATSLSVTWGDIADVPVPADYDGDGKADIAVYRPSTGVWYILQSRTNFSAGVSYDLGMSGDAPAPGDYDGDGRIDPAVYRPSTGETVVLTSNSGYSVTSTLAGGAPTDVPASRTSAFTSLRSDATRASDFDGDRRSDIATYQPATGTWSILKSSTNYATSQQLIFGQAGDIPVLGDYDGDGIADAAVYRPPTGQWLVLESSSGYLTTMTRSWGGRVDDLPVPADYDGDGKTDIAIYRPSTGTWYILRSRSNFTAGTAIAFGAATDIPVPADYDGDGKTDLATYQPATGQWQILTAASGYTAGFSVVWGGESTDVPIAGDYDGDGKADIVIYRPSSGTWFILLSGSNFTTGISAVLSGAGTNTPIVGDYDGDGKVDLAVFSDGGLWTIAQSTAGSLSLTWGFGTEIPLPRRP